MAGHVGSTAMASEVGDARWRGLISEHFVAARAELERYRGHEVKTTGDGLLATFDSPGQALRCAAAWEGPLKNLKLSINLLPADLSREGYEQWLLEEIETAGMDPDRLTVEITESALLVDQDAVAVRLNALRKAGISIAIDDFGTGYASLAYLTSLPLDMIKIDRGLITEIVGRERDRIVVKAMIRLARELDLLVAVEGVESTPQLALLAEWGCDLYQGFLGAGALSQEELWRFVAAAQVEAA